MTTIVVAERSRLLREGMHALLTAAGVLSVAECQDGRQALTHVERTRPDVLILDRAISGLDYLEVIRRLKKSAPHTFIVVLSDEPDETLVGEALRGGAAAFVYKEAGSEELVRAVYQAASGRRCLSKPFSGRPVAYYMRLAARSGNLYGDLTHREREVLHLAIEGLSCIEIGERLGVSNRTVETHRGHIIHKLGLKGQTDLIHWAYHHGVVRSAPQGIWRGRTVRRAVRDTCVGSTPKSWKPPRSHRNTMADPAHEGEQ